MRMGSGRQGALFHGPRDRDGRAPCFAPCPPVSGHSSLHLLLISSAKQGALPSRSRTEHDAPWLVYRASGAGGGWPISGRYKEEVEGRMARDRGTWRKSATRRPRPQCATATAPTTPAH